VNPSKIVGNITGLSFQMCDIETAAEIFRLSRVVVLYIDIRAVAISRVANKIPALID
jgi:hypothetical protein